MSDYASIDFFTDQSLVPDPHPYFDYLRSQNPVLRLPHHGVVAVTGYEEATEVYKDTDTFSNIVALGGPFPPLPFKPEGDDISPQIDQHLVNRNHLSLELPAAKVPRSTSAYA